MKPETALDLANSSSGGHPWRLQSVGGGVFGRVGNFEIWEASTAFNPAIAIQPNGNIGINTTSPSNTLDVNGSFHLVGNATQDRSSGGWVKAMVYVSAGTIVRCYNSTLAGAAATTPPCGFQLGSDPSNGQNYAVKFGFTVNDRFWAASAGGLGVSENVYAICTSACGGTDDEVLGVAQVDYNGFYSYVPFTLFVY